MDGTTSGMLAVGIAVTLLRAAAHKPVTLWKLQDVLAQLNAPRSVVRHGPLTLVAAEITASTTLIVRPGLVLGPILLACLGIAIGAAGGAALRRDIKVPCLCFSSSEASTLGWKQVAIAPLFVAIAVVLSLAPPLWTNRDGLQIAIVTASLLSVVASFRLAMAVRDAAGDRKAVEEVFAPT